MGKNRRLKAARQAQAAPNPFEVNDPTGYFAASHIPDAPAGDELDPGSGGGNAVTGDGLDTGQDDNRAADDTRPGQDDNRAADGGDQTASDDEAYELLQQQMEALRVESETAKTQREQARQRAEAAERAAQELNQRVQTAGATELVQQKQLIEHTFARRQAEATQAEGLYADALQRQDYAAAAKAQRLMAAAEADLQHLNREYVQLEQRAKQPQQPAYQPPAQPVYQQDPFEADIANLPLPVQTWARQHRDDLTTPGRGQIAVAAGQLAAARGFQPGSAEYLAVLDDNMGYSQREQQRQVPAQQRQASPRPGVQVSAPVSRQGVPGSARRTVRLTQDERETAAALGMSETAYAASLQDVDEGRVRMSWMQNSSGRR